MQEIKLVTQKEDLPINQENVFSPRYGKIPIFNNIRDNFSYTFPFLFNGLLHFIPTFINMYFVHEIGSLRKAVSNGLELEISNSQKSTLEQIDYNIGVLYLFLGFDYVMSLFAGGLHYAVSLVFLPFCQNPNHQPDQNDRQRQLSNLISASQMSNLCRVIMFIPSGIILTSFYEDHSIPDEIKEDFISAIRGITPFFITIACMTSIIGCTASYIEVRGRGTELMEKVKGFFSWRSTRRRMAEMTEIQIEEEVSL